MAHPMQRRVLDGPPHDFRGVLDGPAHAFRGVLAAPVSLEGFWMVRPPAFIWMVHPMLLEGVLDVRPILGGVPDGHPEPLPK